MLSQLLTGPSHHDVICAKAPRGKMGTFSILSRMVLRSTTQIFSFVLIFYNFAKNVPMLLD